MISCGFVKFLNGWGIETNHLFLVLNARKVAEPIEDDLEEQVLSILTREELEKAYQEWAFKILSWFSVEAMALKYLGE